MEMHRFILEAPGRISLQEMAPPVPGRGEVVVRVRSALTCGTDVKAYVRGHPKWPMPTPFGHEFAGEIAAVGPGISSWKVGDAVMAAPTAPCGACYFCVRNQENLCETIMATMVLGAYGDFVLLPERVVRQNLHRKHPGISFAAAALMEPLACVLHGLAATTRRADDTTVLLGAGAISLLHLRALRSSPSGPIFVVGRNPQRAQHALALGADGIIVDDLATAQRRIREHTSGRGADLVIECTGQPAVWEAAPGFARRGGHVILFGGCPSGTTVEFDTHRLHYDQVSLTSPFHFTPAAVRQSWEMLGTEEFQPESLISDTLPLSDLAIALERHRRGEGLKFALRP